MATLENIFQTLGINKTNGLYYTSDRKWKSELQLPSRIVRLLENDIQPNAFFCIDNKPLILFFENPTDKDLHKKIWNFNETPIVIIYRDDIVEIFNGFRYDTKLDSLSIIGNGNKLNDFTYFKLVTGKTWEDYQKELHYKNRADYRLLSNIKEARQLILNEFPEAEDDNLQKQNIKITNALLGKMIFVRYLIDRKVKLIFDDIPKIWSNNDFCALLETPDEIIRFFEYLSDERKGFNGDLFPITSDEYKQIPQEAYNIIIRLLKSENITERQQSLFDLYDFSIIPIEFISNVYESFIGLENQAEEGAYYTPLFLVDYILSETVVNAIQNNPDKDCKVLDPACGSGVFLVEVLRKLIEKHIENNEGVIENSEKFKADIKEIAKKNIFGIDKDESAVQVAIFSIYLTLLDYMNPPEIATFRFPILLNTNFFCFDFFNKKALFNTTFKEIEFDFIIGNPPWKGGALGEYGEIYIKERREEEKTKNRKYPVAINNGEIVEGFVLRVSDFSKPKTKCALIVRSSILYNQGYNTEYSSFRRYWLEEFLINKIVELAPVRREVFDKSNDKAIAPAAILFYQYADGQKTDDHVVEHITIKPTRFFSYFKIFTINRHDYKTVEQGLLKRNDWLFKTLVYGSYLDFNLIFRLTKNHTSVKEIISDKTKFIYGTGIHCRKESLSNPKSTEQIKDELFISPYAVESYFIDFEKKDVLERDKVDITKDIQLYQAPMLLVREGIDTKLLNAKSAISFKSVIFKDSITSIKPIDKKVNILRAILGVLSSNLYTYLTIHTFSSIGIERERAKNYNKFSVPYPECNIIELVEFIEKAKIELHSLKQQDIIDDIKCSKLQIEIDNAQHEINESILNALNFNEIEKALLDYALNINRPLITRTERDKFKILGKLQKPLDIYSAEIIDYVGVYLSRFKQNIDNDVRKFVVRIWHNNQVMGMFFEVVPIDTPDENGIIWENADNKSILSWLIQLSSEKITDRLFVQKDIRGFEKEHFYIFKPNEKRLWHKAIAYLDAEEFMDAILRAGRRGE
jgi:hypothetical protein